MLLTVQVGVFLVLRELVTAVPNSTEAQVDMLMPGVLHALQVSRVSDRLALSSKGCRGLAA